MNEVKRRVLTAWAGPAPFIKSAQLCLPIRTEIVYIQTGSIVEIMLIFLFEALWANSATWWKSYEARRRQKDPQPQ
jgi:hypothetical protein